MCAQLGLWRDGSKFLDQGRRGLLRDERIRAFFGQNRQRQVTSTQINEGRELRTGRIAQDHVGAHELIRPLAGAGLTVDGGNDLEVAAGLERNAQIGRDRLATWQRRNRRALVDAGNVGVGERLGGTGPREDSSEEDGGSGEARDEFHGRGL